MKKFFALLAISAIALTGCASKDSTDKPAEEKPGTVEQEKVTLTIGVEESYVPYYTELSKNFTEKNPNVEFEVVGATMFSILDSLEVQKGNSADIFMFPNDRIGDLATKRLIAPVTADISSYTTASQTAANFDGKNYFVPLSTDTTILYYNKTMVDKLPTTLKEIKPSEWSAKYTDFYVAAGMFASNGGYIFGDTTEDIGLNNEGSVKALTEIKTLFHNGTDIWTAMQEDASGYDYQVKQFIDGNLKYYIDGPWKYTDLIKGGFTEDTLGYTVIPSWDGTKEYAPLSGVKGVGINAYSKHVDVAQDFLKSIATAENAQKWFDMQNEVNPHTSVKFEEGSISEVVSNATKIGTTMPTNPEFAKVWVPMADALKQVATDKNVDPKEALDAAVNTIKQDIAALKA